ncbi:MAG: STAS domain-containing protein [Bacteroidia bacterium]|nr:STAS domain-containing protein [Bacteroidia bacterium]MDW8235906.1 STAS domain-containing protein [Bacteroidia bacterium]
MQVEVQPGMNGHFTVKLSGELDALTAPRLYEKLTQLVQQNPGIQKITLHCSGLTYLSSAGAGILLMSMDNFTPKGISLELTQVQPEVYNVLDMLGLTKLMTITHA